MANKNKNTKLVTLSDDDPTSEFEIPEAFRRMRDDQKPEIELDAKTHDFDEAESVADIDSGDELKSALDEQAKLAGELQFEIEQLRSRRRGLEAELKARKEITDSVNGEIKATRKQLAQSERQLRKRNDEFKSLQSALEKTNERAASLTNEAEKLRKAAKADKAQIRSLEKKLARKRQPDQKSGPASEASVKQISALEARLRDAQEDLADLRCYVDGRKDEWSRVEAELATTRERLEKSEAQLEKTTRAADRGTNQLEKSREQALKSAELLRNRQSEIRELRKQNRELHKALHKDAEQEIRTGLDKIARQSGLLLAGERERDSLRKDNKRFEKYADSLRMQLQDQISVAKISVAIRKKTEAALKAAQEHIRVLTLRLEEEQKANEELAAKYSDLRDNFDQEVRQIRFELGAAQETIADQSSMNEQLASDLIDNQGFRQALESQLGEAEEESEKRIRQLSSQLRKAQEEVDDYGRKMQDKDKAIADLMRELATHSSYVECKSDFENALQKIDGFRTDDDGAKTGQADRERVARLLIGNADGRELRFPLFKDRLTIGRTSHNDIQLNMQYVSRRHAVVVTDNGETRVIDWGSKNGVYVNEERVTERFLQSGDVVTIGTTDLRYEERAKR